MQTNESMYVSCREWTWAESRQGVWWDVEVKKQSKTSNRKETQVCKTADAREKNP